MAEAIVSFLVEQLGLLILQEGRLLFGVGDQVQRALTDLKFIKGFLKDADARQLENETIRNFVVGTRDAAYDLEDAIQTFLLNVAPRKNGGINHVFRRFDPIRRYRIGSEIRVITTTISDLRRNLERFDILRDLRDSAGDTSIQSSQDQRRQQLRRTYSHVINRNIVGIEAGVDDLVRHLVKEEHRHRVVSISGMGGCGKSTIANQVYHHTEVKGHFDCLAWVCISQQYQVRDVLESIYVRLTSATDRERQEIARWKDDEIPGRLSRLLNQKKCLIVLDDIWETVTWDYLKAAFECDDISKSRILLTTRNERVASHADVNGFHYKPSPLSETQSWELFEAIALRGRTQIDSKVYAEMEESGKKMVKHCAGLPLAISVLAGLLARKDAVKDWQMIQSRVIAYISRGTGDRNGEHAFTSWVLGSSYNDLPYHLKPCFLYLGLFPEDHVILVNSLTKLWIAEGFIPVTPAQTSSETMEEVAYSWFSELVERYLIQVERVSSTFGEVKTCKMHDLLRDLCLAKAKEENFLEVVNENGAMIPYSSSNNSLPMGKIRRLAVYLKENAEKLVPSREERGDHVRSLLYFGPNQTEYWFPQKTELISSMFKYFKLLRVLRLEGMRGFESGKQLELPNEIGKMVHLRFLSLLDSHVLSFPSFLGNLVSLQTLNFRVSNSEPLTIPNVIWKMNRLRHLYLPREYKVKGILKLSTLHELQTLKYLRIRYCDLLDLTELGNLRKLKIRSSSSPVKNLNNKLNEAESVLKGIRSLNLDNEEDEVDSGAEMTEILARCSQIYKLTLSGPTTELPKDFHSYSNLTKVSLCLCGLKEDQVAKIGKLPNLKSLLLQGRAWGRAFKGNSQTLVFSKGSFPCLQLLLLSGLKGIAEWTVEEGAMLGLCQLYIYFSEELRAIPDGLRHITTLKELAIVGMPEIFCKKLEEEGEDFYKVQHIPTRTFLDPRKDQTNHASTSA